MHKITKQEIKTPKYLQYHVQYFKKQDTCLIILYSNFFSYEKKTLIDIMLFNNFKHICFYILTKDVSTGVLFIIVIKVKTDEWINERRAYLHLDEEGDRIFLF